jgi:TonB family protein
MTGIQRRWMTSAFTAPWWVSLVQFLYKIPNIEMAETKAKPKLRVPAISIDSVAGKFSGRGGSGARAGIRKRDKRGWIFLLLSAGILVGVLWWHWNRGWVDLESDLQKIENQAPQAQAHVPADVMEKLVIHRVDPDYPEAARPENLQGVIVLDVVVGRDGSVLDMHAVNGPEVLGQAAMDALRWWRFEPYRVNGQPVVVETTVAVEFKP